MLAGIVFQLSVIVVFSICAVEYMARFLRDAPIHAHPPRPRDPTAVVSRAEDTPRGTLRRELMVIVAAMGFSTTVLFIRWAIPSRLQPVMIH